MCVGVCMLCVLECVCVAVQAMRIQINRSSAYFGIR